MQLCIPCGALAQLGERLICIQEVIGSIPIGSTIGSGALAQKRSSGAFLGSDAKRLAARQGGAGKMMAPHQLGSVAQVVRAHA